MPAWSLRSGQSHTFRGDAGTNAVRRDHSHSNGNAAAAGLLSTACGLQRAAFPKNLAEDEAGRIVVERLLKGAIVGTGGHWNIPSLSLMIQADHNTMMQLRTHRVGCTFDYQSMRYTENALAKLRTTRFRLKTFFTFALLALHRSPG